MNSKNLKLVGWLGISFVALISNSGCSGWNNDGWSQLGHEEQASCDADAERGESCNSIDTSGLSRDITTGIAQTEQQALEDRGHKLAAQFSLSFDQGLKIAKTIRDFSAIKSRTESDVADFAQRLYGVNPNQIVSAAGKAQMGDNSEMNELVATAARGFDTTPENMKKIVKTLHANLLRQNGIDL